MKTDLTLYAIMLFSGAFQAFLNTDESAKFIEPETLYWMRGMTGIVNLSSTGLKAFTSEAYGKWKKGLKNGNGKETTERTEPTT